jgi:hypothetical protein
MLRLFLFLKSPEKIIFDSLFYQLNLLPMSIVIGWNHFKIKSYTPQDLGILDPDIPDFSIELRQRYFHLFWIPAFGIGKTWALRRNGELYEVPVSLKERLLKLPKKRSPWYTFTLPLLGVLVFAGILISVVIGDYSRKRNSEKYFERSKVETREQLSSLGTKNVLGLAGNSTFFLKVEQVRKDAILFTKVDTGMATGVEQWYGKHRQELDTILISQKELLAGLHIPYQEGVSDPFQIDVPGIGKCRLLSISRYFGPNVVDLGTGGWGTDGMLNIRLANYGWPAEVIEIKNLQSDIKWENQLPMPTDGYGGFSLDAGNYKPNSPYKVQLTLKDTSGTLTKYIVAGMNLDKTVKAIN